MCVKDSFLAEGPKDHNRRSASEVSTMSRRGMHPLMMGLETPDDKVENKPLERYETLMADVNHLNTRGSFVPRQKRKQTPKLDT